MRKITPILIVLTAIVVYSARDTLLGSFMPNPSSRLQTASLAGLVEDSGEPDEMPFLAEATVETRPAEPIAGRIHKNSSLYLEMRKMGFPPAEIERIARASRKTHNLTKVRPGQKFSVYASESGVVDSLVFFVNRERCLKVRRSGGVFSASLDTIPYTVSYHVSQGTIRQSVFASLSQQNAETELAGALDEIFGWTLDFFTDIRGGDTFAVLFERKTFEDGTCTLGEVLCAKVVSRGDEYLAFRFAPTGGTSGYYDQLGNSLQKSLRRSPLKYTRVTSNFSGRRFHPVKRTFEPHWGVDYGAPRGTPVYSTGDGVVVAATRRVGNGNYVKVKHNKTYTTYYLHLSRFGSGIKSGVKVKQGQLIGHVGATGLATAPHVCYRIKKNGSWVNPRTLKLPSKNPVPKIDTTAFQRTRDAYLVRLMESMMTEPDNNTAIVERPAYPADSRMRPVF